MRRESKHRQSLQKVLLFLSRSYWSFSTTRESKSIKEDTGKIQHRRAQEKPAVPQMRITRPDWSSVPRDRLCPSCCTSLLTWGLNAPEPGPDSCLYSWAWLDLGQMLTRFLLSFQPPQPGSAEGIHFPPRRVLLWPTLLTAGRPWWTKQQTYRAARSLIFLLSFQYLDHTRAFQSPWLQWTSFPRTHSDPQPLTSSERAPVNREVETILFCSSFLDSDKTVLSLHSQVCA